MHLKTLTVRGFKSFASSTSFEFEPGVTAVVGPNGSGKSNVVDALAWVMGEQGAKSLRGGKMEDVIFAGTSGRAALGRAHVSLTIDNADGVLPIEYSEVTISRTLFRSGGSEYAINGASCRLLDIQELLSDSGLGREMHVIVGQGQLDRILQATPEERRGFIEEAAGVLKHRRRKEKTLRKLESMQANVSRLEDLTAEVGRQLTPLGRQAKVARRAQRIQHDVRDARARLFADDWVQASTALESDSAELERRRAELSRAERENERLTAEIAELEADAARLGPGVARARDTWYGLSQARERFASLAQLADERIRSASVPTGRAHLRDPEAMRASAERLEGELEEALGRAERRRSEHAEAGERLEEREGELAERERHHTALREAMAERRENLASLRGRLATARSEHESLQARAGEQERDVAAVEERLARHETELERLSGQRGPTAEDQRAASEASDEAHEAAQRSGTVLEAAAARLHEATRRLDAARARVEALRDSLPAPDATEALLARHPGLVERVRDAVEIEPAFAAAAAAALERFAEGLALADPGRLTELLATLREDGLGRAALLLEDAGAGERPGAAVAAGAEDTSGVVGAADDGEGPAATDEPSPGEGSGPAGTAEREELERAVARAGVSARWAPDVVTGGRLAPLVRTLLTRTALVEDADAAARLRAALLAAREEREAEDKREGTGRAGDWTVAAADGTRLSRHRADGGTAGAVSGLEVAARHEQAQRELAGLEEARRRAEEEREEASRTQAQARERAEEARTEFARISREASTHAAEHSRLRALIDSTTEELEAARRRLAELREREPGLARRVEDAAASVSAAVELSEGEGTEALEAAARGRDEASAAVAQARQEETQALIGVRGVESETESLRQRIDAARRGLAAERAAHAEVERQERRRDLRLRAAQGARAMVERVRESIEADLARAHQAHEQAQTRRAGVETRLRGAREAERAQRGELERLRSTAHAGELERAGREATLDSLRTSILEELSLSTGALVEDYGPHLPIPELDEAGEPAGERPYVRAEQERRLQRARKDLRALGKVNPLALEEFAALEERHTYLVQQLEDLRRSRADLEEIIRDVDRHVREVFAQAFHDTQEQFVRVFSTLFPGGEGKLVLTDPSDMLATGIDVHAKPAGKKVKRLSLLSGGERSLTAIALLVAIFKARPSPFYVMDEVEAALDDRNLGRLLTILQELQESSQLIVITHQKRTMEIADALYGVSMRGDGITQVISQRLAELR
ncbi:chromosome segregation SMC family protein [Rothia halotolerans]|uniref:chromosome segregation SMC family protein n=1 Tax=Rothia halotolerans TaxID=405770 RepID=UPI00187709A0|nr:AAA family ATPase [Rothia halotolerans]